MLKDRILSTLKFFDLQDFPLTLFELHKYLLRDDLGIKSSVNVDWEFVGNNLTPEKIAMEEILNCLDNDCSQETETLYGFYCLKGRVSIIKKRWENYLYGIFREKRINRYTGGLKRVPFVRGVALAGSQALGQQKADSDIDLLIIVEPGFMWLGRTLVTFYFQILGNRRHGQRIANRFCLNHYLAGVKEIGELRNLYTASEYAKLRPLVYGQSIFEFQNKNSFWIKVFLPNFEPVLEESGSQSKIQIFFERMFKGSFGSWLENKLKNWQLPKIRQEEFILVREDELSFHPQSKQRELLQKFFEQGY